MVFVTHDQEEAMAIADRIAVMNTGQIEQLGTPLEVYNHPRNLWVAQFIGSHPINVIEARRNGDAATLLGSSGWRKTFPADFPAHGDFLIGVRPEHLVVTPGGQGSDGALTTEVYTRQILGTDILYELKTVDKILRAVTPTSQVFEVGQPVAIGFNWSDAFLFDNETGAALE
jgi:ABC-type sugar transport system ATPase subunit